MNKFWLAISLALFGYSIYDAGLINTIQGTLSGIVAFILLAYLLYIPVYVTKRVWKTSVTVRAQHNLDTKSEEKRLTH
jgi:hypothetical protein